ncbi:MAG: glycosyltransferase, partial [Cyanobacteria bacterium P01_G01_bin.4]
MPVAPTVSVKMLTYNHEAYVSSAVEGVLNQVTNFDFELLIGDDSSTDDTAKIAAQYADVDPRVRLILRERNLGMHQNSLELTQISRGKYIAWCEGDDCWTRTDKLQTTVDYLEANSGVGMVYTDYDREVVASGSSEPMFLETTGKNRNRAPNVDDILLGDAGIATCTVVARSELVKLLTAADPLLYSSGQFLMGDTQLWAEIALKSE